MKKVQNVRSVFFRYVLWLIVVSAILSGLFKVGMEWDRSREEFKQIRKTYLSHHQELLKERVKQVFCFIEYLRTHTESKIVNLRKRWSRDAQVLIRMALKAPRVISQQPAKENH